MITQNTLWGLIFGLVNTDLIKQLVDGVRLVQRMSQERANGPYKVLDFEHTLELCDPHGTKAIYHKRDTVQLLQDHVSAYLDQVWGKGNILADYQCSPGVAVDRYRCGHGYCMLISLREVRRRGDILRISIDRTVRNGFNVDVGWSETQVLHQTRHFRVAIIFPKKRPPEWVDLIETNRNRTTRLGELNTQTLSDGRYRVFWETDNPRLFETYTLKWKW